MGRKRSVHLNLPKGMRARVRPNATYYFYDTGGAEIPLGKDYVAAVRKWADLEGGAAPAQAAAITTFRTVAEAYVASPAFKRLKPRTQRDILGSGKPKPDGTLGGDLAKLYAFFDDPPAPLDSIEPHHIAKYRDHRNSTHSTQEIALLSAIWNWAREQGYTKLANPTVGVGRNRGDGRDVYVTDEMFAKVYLWADQPTKDAMDLAHLAGQRPGDCLKMREQDIRDGALWVSQGKTGTKVRVMIVGKLKAVLDRIAERKAAILAAKGLRSLALVVDVNGKPLSAGQLDHRFGVARECAGIAPADFQFRDLRAKAATETDDARGLEAAQGLLGHASAGMTRKYVRRRAGKLVEPTK
jgi:integrase